MPVHLGVDSKNVCKSRILDGWTGSPFCLCSVGDLFARSAATVQKMSKASVRVSKEKGHAFGGRIKRAMMLLILQLILVGFDSQLVLLMPAEIYSGSKKNGIPG